MGWHPFTLLYRLQGTRAYLKNHRIDTLYLIYGRTNKQSKGVNRQIGYLVEIIKTDQRSRIRNSVLATQPRLVKVIIIQRQIFCSKKEDRHL